MVRFGQGGFDYVSDARADLPVWAAALWRALRIHQWAKNLLLFLPLLVAPQLSDGAHLPAAGLAFLPFGLTASAVYLGDRPAGRGWRWELGQCI